MSPDPIPPDRAVIDRIIGNQAVLLAGPQGHEHTTTRDALPADATEGTWLIIDHTNALRIIGIDHQLTTQQRNNLQQRLQQLRRQRRGGRFG